MPRYLVGGHERGMNRKNVTEATRDSCSDGVSFIFLSLQQCEAAVC